MTQIAIQIELFAMARETVGDQRICLLLDEPVTVATLRHVLQERFPNLQGLLAHSRFALDRKFAVDGDAVHSGQEVALVPPVSGG